MAQNFWYPPGSSQAGVITVNQGTTPWIVSDSAVEASTASIDTKTPTVGQKTMAASSPVVIASNQSAVPVTISGGLSNPLPVSDSAAEASLASIDSKLTNPLPVSAASLPLPSGASTSALQTALNNKTASAFISSPFDETVITYVGATTNIATVTYKLASVTVNTLTLSYDGSNRLIDVVKT